MKLTFVYDENKDANCLLNFGKTSLNSFQRTKVYEDLMSFSLQKPDISVSKMFIRTYIRDNKVNIEGLIKLYQKEWNSIANTFQLRCEKLFEVKLPQDIIVYLTLNNRRPYSIAENYLFVTIPLKTARAIVMHELWHFYTWYKFGQTWESIIGKHNYNRIKESLTVLINVECLDLLPNGVTDSGYLQHNNFRNQIQSLWAQKKDMNILWNELIKKY